MKCLAAIFLISLSSVACLAQESEQLRTCFERAQSQLEMTTCASEEAARVEMELNDIYQTLLSEAASQPTAVENIRSTEEAWIAYRDAYIEAMYPGEDKQAEFGSSYPMQVNLLRARLAQQQIVTLDDLRTRYAER